MWNDHWSIMKPAYFIIWFSFNINFRFSIKWCSRAQKVKYTIMWSTPAVWKQYNKMAVLHFFLVNSPLIYILFYTCSMETVQQNGRFTLFSCKFPSNIYSILYDKIPSLIFQKSLRRYHLYRLFAPCRVNKIQTIVICCPWFLRFQAFLEVSCNQYSCKL